MLVFFLPTAKNASVVNGWGCKLQNKNLKKVTLSLKEGIVNAKSKWGTDKDIMDEKEKIKAPNVYLWARYHFSL